MSKIIYKYFRINEYLFDTLISNQLYFSSISQFNDPYECQFQVKDEFSYEEFELFVNDIFDEKEKIPVFLEKYKHDPQSCISQILDSFKSYLNYIGICCFVKRKDNLLMWSHYADSHKGVCLGFDYNEMTKNYKQFDQVEYSDEHYFFDITNVSGSISKAVLRKSTHWSYEEETRFVVERNKSSTFPITALREINFGLKTSPRHMQSIIYLVTKLGYTLCSFYKATPANKAPWVSFEKVNTKKLREEVANQSKNIPFLMRIDFNQVTDKKE